MPKLKEKSYKQLRQEWYKKLKAEGFNDIERRDGEFKDSWGIPTQLRVSTVFWEAKQEYYYWAEHFLNDYKFDSEIDKAIWEYHMNGIGYRKISDTLAKVNIKMSRQTICRLVMKLKNIMLTRYIHGPQETFQ
jgi:hypothetical protein